MSLGILEVSRAAVRGPFEGAPPLPLPSPRLTCGIIARSAGLFQNSKKVCTCDGVTIWEEEAARRREDSTRATAARL